MAYVYRHIRLDKNEPFYIGIGKSNSDFKRAYSHKNRNVYWNNIVNFTEHKVEIMLENITWDEACEKEIEFIFLYKKNTENGTLCNIADGGSGGYLGEEINEKRRQSLIGHKLTEETKEKIKLNATGRKASNATKLKMSLIHKKNKTGFWLESKGHKNGRAFEVHQYTKDGIFIKTWECAQYAVQFYNMNRTSITDCIKGRQKTAGGFIWVKDKFPNLFGTDTNPDWVHVSYNVKQRGEILKAVKVKNVTKYIKYV
jgi:hypothetical protein